MICDARQGGNVRAAVIRPVHGTDAAGGSGCQAHRGSAVTIILSQARSGASSRDPQLSPRNATVRPVQLRGDHVRQNDFRTVNQNSVLLYASAGMLLSSQSYSKVGRRVQPGAKVHTSPPPT